MKAMIAAVAILIALLLFAFLKEQEVYLDAISAADSDGTDSSDIISNMKDGYELVSLKANPFGFIEVRGFKHSGIAKKAYATYEWHVYQDLGAANIYVGYSFDGKKYFEQGPFDDSGNITIEIPVNPFYNLENLRLRFRGEDADFGPDAIAEVRMKLKAIVYKI